MFVVIISLVRIKKKDGLNKMNKVLIVVDLQNDFVTGPLGTKEAVNIVPKVEKYVKECAGNFYQVIFTKDCHSDFYPFTVEGQYVPKHCIPDTEGYKIVNNLDKGYFFDVLNKETFGYLKWDKELFVAPDVIEIVGVCTDICVISNALILRSIFPKARIIVHSDMCAGTTPEKHMAALEAMKSCLIEVI